MSDQESFISAEEDSLGVEVVESKRSQALSTFETQTLLDLITSRKTVIESKKTDFGIIHKKQQAWDSLMNEFNAVPQCSKRTVEQLKKRWDNLKSRSKKEFAKNKREKRKTGGGPPPKPVSLVCEKVSAVIPVQMDGLQNEFDSDFVPNTIDLVKDGKSPVKIEEKAVQPDIFDQKPILKKHNEIKKSDPRTMLSEWEYTEHQMRVKALEITMQFETERLKKAKLDVKHEEEEHELRKQLLMAQIAQISSPTTIVVPNFGPDNEIIE